MKKDAAYMAQLNRTEYAKVSLRYGGLIDTYRSDAPRSLCLAHILRTNPTMVSLPEGVMRADVGAALVYAVPRKNLIHDITSVYVFCRELNELAHSLYTKHPGFFTKDLWPCAYIKSALRPAVFDVLWADIDPTAVPLDALKSSVDSNRRDILGWTHRQLRKFVLYDCEFVFELAKSQGRITSPGTGTEPIPPEEHYGTIYG